MVAAHRAEGAVLVTGASSGIGRALSRRLAREGFDQILVARRRETLEPLAAELTAAHGVRCHIIAQDLARPGGAADLHREAVASGLPIGMLINNAGVGVYGDFTATPLDEEVALLQLNVTSLVELTKRCLPAMLARGQGRIVNVASTAAFLPGPGMAVYYASKAFVLSFSEAIAEELRNTRVTVTCVCPGPTQSGFQEKARMQQSRLMQGVLMTSEQVADAAYAGIMAGRRVVITGAMNKIVPAMVRVAPRRLIATISRRAAEPKAP